MIKTRYKRGFIKMMDIYGASKMMEEKDVDVIISTTVLFPKSKKELPSSTQSKSYLPSFGKTLVFDLRKSEDELFADIHKNAKYKINRAMKRDQLVYHELTAPTDDQIQEFVDFFNPFAKNKNIPNANIRRLKGLRDLNSLIISYITDADSNVLCYHAYVRTETYCSLLHSASARFENSQLWNLIGRANRYLHWLDLKSFKEKGLEWFDFGGLFVDADANAEKHINQFKMEFGGQVVDVDKRIYSKSIIGKITVFLFWLKFHKRPEFTRAKLLHQNSYSH